MTLANTLVQHVQSMFTVNLNRNARRRAIRSALMSVTRTHPEYAGIGFDEQLMTNEAAALMDAFLNGGPLPTPNALTTAWAAQFPYSDESRKKAIANIMPMVTDFVAILASEASSIPATAPYVSSPIQPYYGEVASANVA